MSELPDYRAEPKASPEGDAIATARHSAWASTELDPIVDPERAEKGYGWDRLAEADRDAMAARAIRESELIGFWLAWHRAGGFAQLERGGWDRSTIFRRIRRFRSYFGVHPDDARFPWLSVDWPRVWSGDRLVALEWAHERGRDAKPEPGTEPRWRPSSAYRSDPHALEPEDPFGGPATGLRPWVVDAPIQPDPAPESE
jgi:hypothetical protein